MTQTLGKNPYRPGVGTRPLYLAGRDMPLRRFRSVLRAAPEQPANMRLTGLRGVGKTVLLGEFHKVGDQDGWASASLELQPSHNTDDGLVEALIQTLTAARTKLSAMERVRKAVGTAARKAGTLGIAWGDFTLTYQPFSDAGREDLGRALFEAVEMAVQKGYSGFVLLLDEAQVVRDEHTRRAGEHPLSLLISSVVALQKAELPLGLVLCGLPTLTGNLLRARSYTERMFRGEEIGSLQPDEAREALIQPPHETDSPVQIDEDLVQTIIEEVEGYPYFIQLWGAELWDAAVDAEIVQLSNPLLDAARPYIYQRLDLDFYDPRVQTLTPAEQDVLLATADCDYPPLVVADLNEAISKSPGNVNVLLGRLVESGVLYRIRKGQYEYTAPKFRDFLLRRTDRA
jgi:DNA-binding transcriptional ArsR family regulator